MGNKYWQPIDTAPKDRKIILLSDEGVYQGKWDLHNNRFEPLELNCQSGNCDAAYPINTHWMDIPQLNGNKP